jgi:type IV pilus assembly protein PilA
MLHSLRQRTVDNGGFTLIELLVVILIIGILAALAIPAFLSQKSKANDAAAKTQVGTLQTAMETYSTENSGTYEGATLAKLEAIEPTLKEHTASNPSIGTPTKTEYEASSTSVTSGDKFTVKNVAGVISRSCTTAGKGGCPAAGTW